MEIGRNGESVDGGEEGDGGQVPGYGGQVPGDGGQVPGVPTPLINWCDAMFAEGNMPGCLDACMPGCRRCSVEQCGAHRGAVVHTVVLWCTPWCCGAHQHTAFHFHSSILPKLLIPSFIFE